MSQLIGHISQVIGPVVDVYFEGKSVDEGLLLPSIHDALTVKRDDGRTLVLEVQQIGKSTRLNSSHTQKSRMPSSA